MRASSCFLVSVVLCAGLLAAGGVGVSSAEPCRLRLLRRRRLLSRRRRVQHLRPLLRLSRLRLLRRLRRVRRRGFTEPTVQQVVQYYEQAVVINRAAEIAAPYIDAASNAYLAAMMAEGALCPLSVGLSCMAMAPTGGIGGSLKLAALMMKESAVARTERLLQDAALAAKIAGATTTAEADLAATVTAEKVARGVSAGHNGAVFEYVTEQGTLDYIFAFSERTVCHAERIGSREVSARGISPDAVKCIYSPLEPCAMPGGYCAAHLSKTYPNAAVSWTYPYPTDDPFVRAANVVAMRKGG